MAIRLTSAFGRGAAAAKRTQRHRLQCSVSGHGSSYFGEVSNARLDVGTSFDGAEPLRYRLAHINTEVINLELKDIVQLIHVTGHARSRGGENKSTESISCALIFDSKFTLMQIRATQSIVVESRKERVRYTAGEALVTGQQKSVVPTYKSSLR
jgi:hypothetical protein